MKKFVSCVVHSMSFNELVSVLLTVSAQFIYVKLYVWWNGRNRIQTVRFKYLSWIQKIVNWPSLVRFRAMGAGLVWVQFKSMIFDLSTFWLICWIGLVRFIGICNGLVCGLFQKSDIRFDFKIWSSITPNKLVKIVPLKSGNKLSQDSSAGIAFVVFESHYAN